MCKICNIWKERSGEKELSAEQLDQILGDPFWKEIKYVNITGGEPFLRSDLTDLIYTIKKNLPKLRLITISTNGFLTNKIIEDMNLLLNSIFGKGDVLISVTISIDGPGPVHNYIRGVPSAYDYAVKTFSELKKLEENNQNFTVGIETVISELNIHVLKDIYAHNSKLTDHLNFTLAMNAPYYRNEDERSLIQFSNYTTLIDFFKKMKSSGSPLAYYYENVATYLIKGRRTYPCLGGYKTICMEPNGDLTPCAILSSVVLANALKDDLRSIWFGERARRVRKDLKESFFCKHCLNNCDIINNYTEEFLHFMVFLMSKPKIALKMYRNIKKGYGSKYIGALWGFT